MSSARIRNVQQDAVEIEVFSLEETACHLGVSLPTVMRFLRIGKLVRLRVGQRAFVTKVSVERVLASRTVSEAA